MLPCGMIAVKHQAHKSERYSNAIFVLEDLFKGAIQILIFCHPNVAQKCSQEQDILKLFSLLNVFNLGVEDRIRNDFFIIVHDPQYDLWSFHEGLILRMKFKGLDGQGLEILLSIKRKLENIPNSVALEFVRSHSNRLWNRNVSVRYMSQRLRFRSYIIIHRNAFKTTVGLRFVFIR